MFFMHYHLMGPSGDVKPEPDWLIFQQPPSGIADINL